MIWCLCLSKPKQLLLSYLWPRDPHLRHLWLLAQLPSRRFHAREPPITCPPYLGLKRRWGRFLTCHKHPWACSVQVLLRDPPPLHPFHMPTFKCIAVRPLDWACIQLVPPHDSGRMDCLPRMGPVGWLCSSCILGCREGGSLALLHNWNYTQT